MLISNRESSSLFFAAIIKLGDYIKETRYTYGLDYFIKFNKIFIALIKIIFHIH